MKVKYLIIILIVLILGGAGAYYYFYLYQPSITPGEGTDTSSNGFIPFNRGTSNIPNPTPIASNSATSSANVEESVAPIVRPPRLRLLSETPVGGYGASTTAPNAKLATPGYTSVRFVDRGRGNVYEAQSISSNIVTLSNTVAPLIVDSMWNKNTTGFLATMLDNDELTLVWSELRPQTSTSTAPYELKGRVVTGDILATALSPKQDSVFILVDEGDMNGAYIATIDGQKKTKIFTTPLAQVTAEWPEENTIAITTKPSASQDGFLYFVSPKTGVWKKIAGPLKGLTAKVSHDAKYALISTSWGGGETMKTFILEVATKKETDPSFRTISDKCAWGNFYKDLVYCAIPANLPAATYPNDWNLGNITFTDKIWQVHAETGNLTLISDVSTQAKTSIDAYKLGLDSKDNFLYFINKNGLSFWSLDLVAQ